MSKLAFTPRHYPATRLRRPRAQTWSRNLMRETRLSPDDLIWAIVLKDGKGVKEPVDHMNGVFRLSPDEAVKAAQEARALGINALALFPYTDRGQRSADGAEALNSDNLMCRTAKAIKDAVPDVGLICDVALDPYTDHGHDGLMQDGIILNDETVEVLCRQAVVQAEAGFDIVAPSDMMDGRIGKIREALDGAGLGDRQIMSYAVKYASCFYGPYRGAIGSGDLLKGDKKTYQMDPANADEGLHEVALDLAEGADSVMVKPGMPYLDMITRVKQTFGVPTYAFQVSGEYAMIAMAGDAGAINRDQAILESLVCFRRAGADGIISYFAKEAAELMT
ncbi:porphobilinogen synthase [Aquisalinus flavus]|uniref:Delta-aminolevulinic acid dehydratase n=1 Tax=Aquisalinus flavus TaxID=1526572 RepID=A0A8J2V466_9PROT|nr:porphobilinogen synthase [Aquisalinus flavus]MBD0427687.1 porphobilinogen synthase [Aquisalinus flavus]UNE47467.1 porphobilinogen synthase [Aquisalinus flavus]GGD03012.1 delta-aminolevulinic acid dehydratase [Aquisalinus flavus]